MSNHSGHNGTVIGTIGGTLLSIFANINLEDVTRTVLLATIGAVVSFGVSLLLKKITRLISK